MVTAVPVQPVDQEPDVDEMTAADRCDHASCRSQAYYRCHFLEGILTFCRHHFLPMQETLEEQSLMVEDFTYLLD